MSSEVINCSCLAVSSSFSVVEVFLSSFLAFLSALAVEALWEMHKTSGLRKQLKKALVTELRTLKDTLSSMQSDEVYIKPYSVPVWNGASKSGSMLCLEKNKNFNDVLKFFSLVEEASMIEMEAYEILNINPRVNKAAILQNVIECRVQIQSEIDDIINILSR